MSTMTVSLVPDDASLAIRVAAGDEAALAAIYDRYAGRLLGFCQSMLRRQADAEDCLQDVFVIAATSLGQLREPAFLRGWLSAVARRECLERLDRIEHIDHVPSPALVADDVLVDDVL